MQIPTYALLVPAHTRIGKDCGGIFLPNNSRHSRSLKFVFATLHRSFRCHHFLVTHLSDTLVLVAFSQVLKQGGSPCNQQTLPAVTVSSPQLVPRAAKATSSTSNLCPTVQPFHGSCTFMSVRLLSCPTSLKLL